MRKVLYIFGLLTDADVEWMAQTGTRRWVEAGEVLIQEGKPVDAVILLLDGELTVSVKGVGEISRLGVGEIVGELSYVDSPPRPRRPSRPARGPCACSSTRRRSPASWTATSPSDSASTARWRSSWPTACAALTAGWPMG